MAWVTPVVKGATPPGVGGCAAVVVGDLCLFIGGADRTPRGFFDVWALRLGGSAGGGASSSSDASASVAAAAALDADAARWIKKSTTCAMGVTLPDRAGAAAVAIGRVVYVLGGQDPTTCVCFNDVLALDCYAWEWSRVAIEGNSPPPRNSHVACAIHGGRRIVMYGGANPDDGPLGDVHVLDLRPSIGDAFWSRPAIGGQAPEPREMHAACMLPAAAAKSEEPSEMMIVGGRSASGTVLGDVCVLDVNAMRWARRGDAGVGPVCAHAIVPWSLGEEPAGLVFGGFTGEALRGVELRAVTSWTLQSVVVGAAAGAGASGGGRGGGRGPGKPPDARFAHAALRVNARATATATRAMVVFGGVTPAFDLNDVVMWVEAEKERGGGGPATADASDLD